MKRIMSDNLKFITLAIAMMSVSAVSAQDFGYPTEKAFYKAHWGEILTDLGSDFYVFDTRYVLYDFDHDGRAELYLWKSKGEEYLYAIQNDKAVRVSETARPIEDNFWLGAFYAHYMAPYELLIDEPIAPWQPMEQHIYDMFDIPHVWFGMHPKVEGKFNIKSAIEALACFDCQFLSDAMYYLAKGKYDAEEPVDEFVVDLTNGYARFKAKDETMNMVEFCYWNKADGKKLLAMHYHTSETFSDGDVTWFEQILFMEYNPKTQEMTPVVAPIKGLDLQEEFNMELPRRGKDIRLIGVEESWLKWTGEGFEAPTP